MACLRSKQTYHILSDSNGQIKNLDSKMMKEIKEYMGHIL